MLPSHEIYNRVIWDKRLNPNAFVFGYTDRLSSTGIKQKPLVDWDTNGDIPWHRIRYILCKNTIVWDRDQHIDKFSSGELPNEAWQLEQNLVTLSESESVIAIFSSQSIYHQDLMGWQVYHQGKENILIDSLSIVTFNVLSDMYEADKIYTNERIPIIVEHLKNSLADIIILQEVTKPLFNQLLKEDWIKDYFTSEAPEAPSLAPQNLVIFSKFPFTLVEHWHSPHKRSFVASWQINDNALHLAAVHLISNRANKAEEVRATQIATLLKYLATLTGDCIIAGDFNVAGNEHDRDFLDNGFEDIWKILKAKEIGYTFDPELNPLAKLMSLQGKQARFDRVLLRSKTHNWQAKEIAIFACKPFNKEKNLFASDHFALKTVLRNTKTNMLETISPIYQSAIVIIPPKELWPNIQAIRKLYDKKIDRWMPHITLIYGFIPEEYFQQASELILQALSKVKPFTITLNGFKTFSHRKSSTAWLEPLSNPEKALVELQATLQSLFPKCNEQSNKPSGFTPHLSVGQFENPALAQKLLPSWEKIEFQVNTVALISRRGDQPFEVCYKVALGKNLKVDKAIAISSNGRETLANTLDRLSPAITKEQKSKQEAVISIIKQACKESLGQEASLHLIGSTRLGVQNQTSDLDIICIIPETLTGQEFLSKIKDQLSGFYQQARIITNAQVPILKLKIDDILIDLLYVRSSLFPFSIPLNALSQRYFDQTSWQTLVGCLEADILLEIVSLYVELEVFRIFLRAIRLWARSRAILGNAWGFPGSFSWTILAAWSCNNLTNPKTTPEELLANFFNRASQHNWSEPIALTESAKKYHVNLPKDRLPIITSIKPNQNSARNISRSTAEIVKQELVLGAKILAQIQKGELGWDKLFEIPKLNRKSQKLLFINIIAKNTNDLENSIGWLEGHIFGLIINLEQLNITLRPWPKVIKQQTSGQIALELSTSLEKSDPKLNEILESFSKTFYTDPSYLKGVKIEIEVCLAEEKPL
ncbi:MAG: DUF504 domain-containing protein [Acidobacteria bacterium]|nr:DUF504 domain-containing protein [Acidobacteriota bacterium]